MLQFVPSVDLHPLVSSNLCPSVSADLLPLAVVSTPLVLPLTAAVMPQHQTAKSFPNHISILICSLSCFPILIFQYLFRSVSQSHLNLTMTLSLSSNMYSTCMYAFPVLFNCPGDPQGVTSYSNFARWSHHHLKIQTDNCWPTTTWQTIILV